MNNDLTHEDDVEALFEVFCAYVVKAPAGVRYLIKKLIFCKKQLDGIFKALSDHLYFIPPVSIIPSPYGDENRKALQNFTSELLAMELTFHNQVKNALSNIADCLNENGKETK